MSPRAVGLLLVTAIPLGGGGTAAVSPTVGCRDTHEWVDVGNSNVSAVAGVVQVRYQAGDVVALPGTTVIVARVEPSIQAFVAETDKAGQFSLPGIPDGQWRINVCHAGFKALEGTVTVAPGTARNRLELITEVDW